MEILEKYDKKNINVEGKREMMIMKMRVWVWYCLGGGGKKEATCSDFFSMLNIVASWLTCDLNARTINDNDDSGDDIIMIIVYSNS